jgi:hypothetical protein
VLYNPDAKGLTQAARVEQLRERVYATLEEYTRYLENPVKGQSYDMLLSGFKGAVKRNIVGLKRDSQARCCRVLKGTVKQYAVVGF